MASHLFVKPHRHTPAEDTTLRRIGDALYVLVAAVSGLLWSAIEDGAVRIVHWLRRRRS